MMPHPERGAFLKQVPAWMRYMDAQAPWEKLFVSLKESL